MLRNALRAVRIGNIAKYSTKSFDEIPRSSKLSNFISILKYNQKIHELHEREFRKHGEIVRLWLPRIGNAVLLFNPQDIKKVYMAGGPYAHRGKCKKINGVN